MKGGFIWYSYLGEVMIEFEGNEEVEFYDEVYFKIPEFPLNNMIGEEMNN